jgi:hypothetical protein
LERIWDELAKGGFCPLLELVEKFCSLNTFFPAFMLAYGVE